MKLALLLLDAGGRGARPHGAVGGVDDEADDASDEDVEFFEHLDKVEGDANSVMNFNAGLGMEYKVTRSFGLGAKWGFGLSLAPTSRHEFESEPFDDVEPATSNTVFGTSASIYLAFRI